VIRFVVFEFFFFFFCIDCVIEDNLLKAFFFRVPSDRHMVFFYVEFDAKFGL